MKPLPRSSGDALADKRADYAEMLFQSGDIVAAADLMLQAMEMAPGWVLGWFRLGEFHEAAGQIEQAAEAWRMTLELDPDDHAGATLKLALTEAAKTPARPPSAFVEALFDQYAPNFDVSLVEKLGYRVPELLAAAIEAVGYVMAPPPRTLPGRATGLARPSDPLKGEGGVNLAESPSPLRGGVMGGGETENQPRMFFPRAVDLGCGTGLMGEQIRPIVGELTGYDISAEMLAKAEAKGIYDRLQKADLQTLDGTGLKAGLVTAADVFMYLGALDRMFMTAAQMLVPGGLFAFSVEAFDGEEDYVLRESRRYAHSETYVRSLLVAAGFSLLSLGRETIRMDRDAPIKGLIVVALRD